MPLGTFDPEPCTEMGIRFDLFLLSIAVLCAPCLSDLVLSKVDRRVCFSFQFLLHRIVYTEDRLISLKSIQFYVPIDFFCLV